MSVLTWTLLTSQSKPRGEELLFKFRPQSGGYLLQVTNLSEVWQEALSTNDLVDQAASQKCPIDPGQDEEQRHILIQHLETALLSMSASGKAQIDHARDSLNIHIEHHLPGGLPPLKWNFSAKLRGKPAFRHEVLGPLVTKVNSQALLIDKLVQLCKDRDAAIDGVIDKIDSSGVELSSLFPTAKPGRTSRRLDQKELIKRTVKGLQPFDAATFLHQDSSDDQPAELFIEGLTRAFGSPNASHDLGRQNHKSLSAGAEGVRRPSDGDTYTPKIQRAEDLKQERHPKNKHENISDDATTEDEEDCIESDHHRINSQRSPKSDDTSDPDTHRIVSRQSNNTTPAEPQLSGGSKKLGAIGGSKRRTPVYERDNRRSPDVSDQTPEGQDMQSDLIRSPQAKARIGAIGGRKKQSPTIANAATVSHRTSETGGDLKKSRRSPSQVKMPLEKRSSPKPTPIRQDDQAEPELDAGQKREKLKRELESQNKPQGKKKRKF